MGLALGRGSFSQHRGLALKKQSNKNVAWLRPAAIAPHFLVCMGLGYYFGTKLDGWFETNRVFSIIFLFVGIAAGFVNLFRELAIVNREEAEKDRDDGET